MEAEKNSTTPRQFTRLKTFKGGEVFYAEGRGSRNCTIRDLTPLGARLRFAVPYEGPSNVTLQIGSGDLVAARVPCKIMWRRSNEVGVKFDREVTLQGICGEGRT